MAEKFDKDSPDPLTMERGKCLERNSKVQKMADVLHACEQRVTSKSYTAESCSQEVVDLMEALDHCVGSRAFAKIA
ncbi:cytochrome b-c1 complex subunit 6, mitochondrial-like isoform X2 [Maniola hyperantus]|uniref:cytochrome b-c1 complex subunit 6, mitochondrial-like isoform X2 n=1 Tax=Aphantopus hyperantus TaxID=2795564 RepID=UPI00156A4143|nr:cytochrome b-c1 complex subunit 6, mitochondrial-like [Maniola hyperantus]